MRSDDRAVPARPLPYARMLPPRRGRGIHRGYLAATIGCFVAGLIVLRIAGFINSDFAIIGGCFAIPMLWFLSLLFLYATFNANSRDEVWTAQERK